jgi:hypothetical protein
MPLKLNVGVSRKVGQPDYGSVGASINLELEVESRLLETDLDGFHARVRDAYVAAHQAVNDELARLQGHAAKPVAAPATPANGHALRNAPVTHANGAQGRPEGPVGRPSKPATASQVRAIVTIARRQRADLAGLLRDDYGAGRPEDLSLAEASRLIDALKAAGEV